MYVLAANTLYHCVYMLCLLLAHCLPTQLIRTHSMAAGMVVKGEGKSNDLLERVRQDDAFKAIHDKIDSLVDPMLFIGRCPEQVCTYCMCL
jgi:hypothetical protein